MPIQLETKPDSVILDVKDKTPGLNKWLFSEVRLSILLIVVVNLIAFGLFFEPALFVDDWSQGINRVVLNNARWLDLSNRRPLLFTPFLIQSRIFGLNIVAYYLVLWFFHILVAGLLYGILNRFSLMRRYSAGIMVSLLFLVYPTNYTNMWLTTIHIFYAAVLTLGYGYLLLLYTEKGNWLVFVLAILCLVISFGFYEAQLGIACAWALILIVICSKVSLSRRVSLLIPIVIGGAFMLWRTLGYQTVGILDPYLSHIQITPKTILSDLILGFKVSLVWGWTTTLQYLFPWLPDAKYGVLFLAGIVICLVLLIRYLTFTRISRKDSKITYLPPNRTSSSIRFFIYASLFGLILLMAGYIPIITLYEPNLSGLGSRVNLFAGIGSAIFFASILMILSMLLAKSQQQIRILFFASVSPLIILGIMTQVSVQRATQVAWREQQNIWAELFTIAPGFKDRTTVLFILPGYQDRVGYKNWQRTPFSASWEVSSGIRLLYNNPTLSADVVFPEFVGATEPILTTQGIVDRFTGELQPYSQVVAYYYDHGMGSLQQLNELPVELVEGATNPIKLEAGRILSTNVVETTLRWLVEVK